MHSRRTARIAVSVVCALAAVLAPAVNDITAGVAAAAPSSSSSSGLAQVRADLAESSQAMLTAATQLTLARNELPRARSAATAARHRLLAARAAEARAAQQRGVAQTDFMLATQGADRSGSLVTEQQTRLGRVARAAYQRGGPMGDISMLLEARSPSDFTERLVMLDSVATSQRAALADVQSAQATVDGQASSLAMVRDRLATAHERAQARAEAVTELTGRSLSAEHDVRRLVASQTAALADAQSARAEDERRLAELTAVSTGLQTQLAVSAQSALGTAGSRAGGSFPVAPGVFAWPVVAPVTSPFGIRVHPITGVRKLHTGTDLGASCGTQIRVARPGVVVSAGFNRAYGWRTVVSHGVVDGALLTTTYNHQQGPGVVPGQQLAAGEVLGVVGTTGYSTGCHLHFEVIVNSDFVDPAPWLAAGPVSRQSGPGETSGGPTGR